MAGRVAALGGALVCAGIASVLVWSAIEPFVRFEAGTCTIRDRRMFSREIRRSQTFGQSSTPTRRYGVPLTAVRIESGAAPVVTTGFAVGMATRSVYELRRFAPGARVPCWVPGVSHAGDLLVPVQLAAGLAPDYIDASVGRQREHALSPAFHGGLSMFDAGWADDPCDADPRPLLP